MKVKLLLAGFLFPVSLLAQSRLVMTGASYVVIDNNAKLVIENPATNGITNSGTGGIMTESEFDQVVWFVGNNTGTYVMPFVSQAVVTQIPFTATITGAGTGGGTIRFSTYPGANWNNDTYRPSDVTHMFDYNTNSVNNSNHVIDRFWVIDALGYGTKPAASFTFTYRDAEHLQVGNSIVEADLGAQRFHTGPNLWGDYLPQGTTNTVANQTSNVPVPPSEFWRSWTLSEVSNPLSVQLTYFKGTCSDNSLNFNWETSSESNVDRFDIERLVANNFEVIASVPAIGGGTMNSYSYGSTLFRSGVFRLIEITGDGERIEKSSIHMDCSSGENFMSFDNTNNTLYMQFEGLINADQELNIFDATGRIVHKQNVAVQTGSNFVAIPNLNFSKGYYAVRLQNGTQTFTDEIIKSN